MRETSVALALPRKATRGTSVPVSFLVSRMMWVLDIFSNNFTANIACGTNKIAARPQRQKLF